MLNWLKAQATEVSALAGVALIAAPLLPWYVCVGLGIAAISTNDQDAANYAKKFGAWFASKVNQ